MEYRIRWDLCVLWQEETSEAVKQPAKSNNPKNIEATYNDAARLLKEFADINDLPDTFFPQLSIYCLDREVIADLLIKNKATWHASCKSKITQTKLSKCTSTIKRKSTESKVGPSGPKKTRSQIPKFDQNACFIPGCAVETSEEEPLRAVMSKELDCRFRKYAEVLNDTELLTKLAGGDLIAQEAKYHSTCAVSFYTRVRSKLREQNTPASQNVRNYEQIAFLHLVSDVEEYRYDTDVPTFVLSELVSKYDKILANILPEELCPPSKTHSTRLKDKLLAEIPDLHFYRNGKQGYLAFNAKITALLHENIGVSGEEAETKI